MHANYSPTETELSILLIGDGSRADRLAEALRPDSAEGDPPIQVQRASTVEEGLDALAEATPSGVLLDLTGERTFERLDAVTDAAAIPLIAVVDSEDDGRRALDGGACEYFVDDDLDERTFGRSVHHTILEGAPGSASDRLEVVLSAVDRLNRDLRDADSREEVCGVAANACLSTFSFPSATVVLYDDETGRFRPVGDSEVSLDVDSSLLDSGTGPVWEAFATGTSNRIDDLEDRLGVEESTFGSCLLEPVGRYGVVVVGADETGYFSSADERIVRLLAGTLQSAFERLERQSTLEERDREIERRDAVLERVERMNDVVRNVVRSVTQASTRDELERAVCNLLGNGGAYRLAWIGEREGIESEVTVRSAAGTETDYLEDVSIAVDGVETPEPAAETAMTYEPQAEQALRTDPPFESWRREALRRGFRSIFAVPLAYKDSQYGVLALYADQQDGFSDAEREVFVEVGNLVAYAINAIERKRALVGDNAIELEFSIGDPTLPQLQLLQATNSSGFEFESVVQNPNGTLRVFFTIRGDDLDLEHAYEFAEQSLIVDDYSLISADENELQFECTLIDPNIVSTMLDHGAVPKKLAADGDRARLTVEVPQSADVRQFVTMVQSKYDDTELVARRKRDRPIQTQQEFMSTLQDHLTDRQSEAIRTAFYSGFFEWPRESTGEDIAERMDVSQPTFTRHLRAAERNLLTVLFEGVDGE